MARPSNSEITLAKLIMRLFRIAIISSLIGFVSFAVMYVLWNPSENPRMSKYSDGLIIPFGYPKENLANWVYDNFISDITDKALTTAIVAFIFLSTYRLFLNGVRWVRVTSKY